MIFDVGTVQEICSSVSSFKDLLVGLELSPTNSRARKTLQTFINSQGISVDHFKVIRRNRSRGSRQLFPSFDCPVCGTHVPEKHWVSKFCSHSCAATFNNRKYPKRSAKHYCTDCKKPVYDKKTSRCRECKHLFAMQEFEHKTIVEVLCKGNARTKYAQIRKSAGEKMRRLGVAYRCALCGFDIVVEVHHIKCIGSFPGTSLVADVNNLSNLIYLCPNHHAMVEKGLISLVEPVGIEPTSSP